MRSGNPALKADTFDIALSGGETSMTIQGTVWKTWILLALVIGSGAWSWNNPEVILASWFVWCILSLIVAFVTIFKKTWAPVLAPIYAITEGLMLGAISMLFEKRFPGIVMQAILLTFGTLGALLFAYQSRMIRVTENFKLGIAAATGGVALVYLVDFGMRFFGKSIPLIHQSTPMGIGFSLVVVVIASLNLVLDFDFIESGAENGAPKYMEWYGAFGLMVTLIWLYLELLRLLAKARSRN